MISPSTDTYAAAGVSLDAMDGIKDRIKAFAELTHGPEVLDGGGGFAGLFALGKIPGPGAGRQHGRRGHEAKDCRAARTL